MSPAAITRTWDARVEPLDTGFYGSYTSPGVRGPKQSPIVNMSYPGGRIMSVRNGALYYAMRNGKVKVPVGGAFFLSNTKVYDMRLARIAWDNGTTYGEGVITPSGGTYLAQPYDSSVIPELSDGQLDAWGTKGVAASIPTNPLADAATFLGELRDLPSLPLASTLKHGVKEAPGEYLNAQFGINPLIRDLKSFGDAYRRTDKYLNELAAGSGARTHRRAILKDDSSWSTATVPLVSSNFSISGSPFRRGDLKATTQTRERIWFEGEYTYLYQRPNTETSTFGKLRAIRDVYGLDPSIETLWNVTPYSWLADWYGTLGESAHNLSRFSQDGLVMFYGYVMRHYEITTSYNYGASSWTVSRYIKQRRPANPFGFGIENSSLTDRQKSILGALGLQKILH